MKKRAKDWIKVVSLIPVVLLSPLIILVEVLAIILATGTVFSEVQRHRIRGEIISYIQENRDNITLINSDSYQKFFYTATGLQDGGVEYGYYYAPDDDHRVQGEPYRKGYRTYGIPDDDTDWYYTERISENWFYYEIHDG